MEFCNVDKFCDNEMVFYPIFTILTRSCYQHRCHQLVFYIVLIFNYQRIAIVIVSEHMCFNPVLVGFILISYMSSCILFCVVMSTAISA